MRVELIRQLPMLICLFVIRISIAAAQNPPPASGPQLTLTSPAFQDGGKIPEKYVCRGANGSNVSPALEWRNAPKGTASFVVYLHDMEPRRDKGLDDILHGMLWNVPGTATGLPENVPSNTGDLPDGSRQTKGRYGEAGSFGSRGPCPPVGVTHHYVFELFALDKKLDHPAGATRADLFKAMDGHILAPTLRSPSEIKQLGRAFDQVAKALEKRAPTEHFRLILGWLTHPIWGILHKWNFHRVTISVLV